MVSGQSFGSSAVSLVASPLCAQHNVFLAATLFVWPLDHSFTPIPPPCILPLLISVPGAWFHWLGGSWLEGAGLPAMGA